MSSLRTWAIGRSPIVQYWALSARPPTNGFESAYYNAKDMDRDATPSFGDFRQNLFLDVAALDPGFAFVAQSRLATDCRAFKLLYDESDHFEEDFEYIIEELEILRDVHGPLTFKTKEVESKLQIHPSFAGYMKIVGGGHWVEFRFLPHEEHPPDSKPRDFEIFTYISLNPDIDSFPIWLRRTASSHFLETSGIGKTASEAFGKNWGSIVSSASGTTWKKLSCWKDPVTAKPAPLSQGTMQKAVLPLGSLDLNYNLWGRWHRSSQVATCKSCGYVSGNMWRTSSRPLANNCLQCGRTRDDAIRGRDGKRKNLPDLPLEVRLDLIQFLE